MPGEYKGACWYCTEYRADYVQIPTGNRAHGFYCNWSCALAYLRDEAHPLLKKTAPARIFLLDKKAVAAPSKFKKIKFGGKLTPDEFLYYEHYCHQLRLKRRKKNKGFVFTRSVFIQEELPAFGTPRLRVG